jgi:hypothetical protein
MVLIRKRNKVEFIFVSANKGGYAKLIRVDDVEHRKEQKLSLMNNSIFQSMYKVIQKKILKGLDEPSYVYIELKRLRELFFVKNSADKILFDNLTYEEKRY